jgi:hypothetical protein
VKSVLYGAVAVSVALMPTLAALIADVPVVPPSGFILLRAVLVTAAGVVLACALLISFGSPAPSATIGVAVGAGLFGVYPLVRVVLPGAVEDFARPFAISYLAGCILAAIVIARARLSPKSVVYPVVSIYGAVIALSMLLQIWLAYAVTDPSARVSDELQALAGVAPAQRPDVYHVIVDGFGRPDVLRDRYQLDVSDFVRSLTTRGFEVAGDGTANYVQTSLSIASMLNIAYIDRVAAENTSRRFLYELIQASPVIEAFKSLGYEFHFVGSIYSALRSHRLADVCECSYPLIGEFESTVLKATPWSDIGLAGLDHRAHRQKIQHSFDALEALEPSPRPRLVLAHFLSPHPPFVFDANGGDTVPRRLFAIDDGNAFRGPWEEYRDGYRQQARYIAHRLLRAVEHFERISRAQGRDAVIIVHGDHGPRYRWDVETAEGTDAAETLPVLLAIRWPGPSAPDSRPRSLVNVYRVLFARYFGAPIEPVPDRSFVSSFQAPYRFIEIDPSSLGRGVAASR